MAVGSVLGKVASIAAKTGTYQKRGEMYNKTMHDFQHPGGLTPGGQVATGFLGLKANQADEERKKRKDSMR